MPCKIQYQETAHYPLEQCQVCEQLEELSRWKEKIFVKELVKTIDLWYENCEDVASQGDKTTLLYEKCDIEDVLSSKKIKEEFLKGPARSTKLITSTGTKDFPVYEISEMKEMINENRISLRDFILQLWCWITAIRSLGENGKACKLFFRKLIKNYKNCSPYIRSSLQRATCTGCQNASPELSRMSDALYVNE